MSGEAAAPASPGAATTPASFGVAASVEESGPVVGPDGTLVLDDPVDLPDTLDMLIVGGGPLGTAAGFRAKELGIAALVIDYDDLMARIRDYAKDKLIYPSYGGGDTMKFPLGGELVSQLHFSPIDKDGMFRQWKALYARSSVPARIGVELLGLERDGGDVWTVRAWNHRLDEEQRLRARHVVLGFGRGVPRRLDIPGNVEGLAFRLTDASDYVGEAACVIGGGTSAAEAVIEISNAKVEADDPSPVCWSYRGDKMPKVSKALAEVFFDAYLGNGNIRYVPKSNPEAVVTGKDGVDRLQIRTDELGPDGKPLETRPLEFDKRFCIACIGSEIPERLLGELGIHLVSGGKSNKKRMAVSPLLESVLPNVYLAGDMLSPVYLETDDFEADPATFREVKRRGNIKAALRDGVFVTEVVAQKLAGKQDVHVELEYADVEEKDEGAAVEPAAAAAPPAPREPRAEAVLVRVLPSGVEADEYTVRANDVTTIGRRDCDVSFADDSTLADRHATISHGRDGYFVEPGAGGAALFLQAAEDRKVEVGAGTILKVGQQWLVCAAADEGGLLLHFDAAGEERGSHRIGAATVVIGRQAPDIVLDRSDMTLSRRHLSMSFEDGRFRVRDLKSLGGTFIKVEELTRIDPGDLVLLGQQRLKLSPAREAAPSDSVRVDPSQSAILSRSQLAAAPAGDGPAVTFQGAGKTCPLAPGMTLCEIAEENGIDILAECHAGVCGSDPIRIESGAEHLNEISDDERDALEDICSLQPGEYRLACMARASGPVVVRIVDQ